MYLQMDDEKERLKAPSLSRNSSPSSARPRRSPWSF